MTNVTPLLTWLAAMILLVVISALVLWGLDLLSFQELAPRFRAYSVELA